MAATERPSTAARRVTLERFHVLGWQSFAEVSALGRLRLASTEFRKEVQQHLLTALQTTVRGEDKSIKEIKALARLAREGDARSISAVATRLGDSQQEVRKAALLALRRLAPRGNECALAAISSFLKPGGDSCEVRITALAALGRLGIRGGEDAICQVAGCFTDGELSVRMAAIDAMRCLVDRGDPIAVEKVAECCRHDQHVVREAALIALNQLAEKGDARAIDMVAKGLNEEDPEVRKTAIKALECVSPRGHVDVAATLSAQLATDSASTVRIAAAEALGTLVIPGSALVQDAVLACLEDDAPEVRRASVSALERTMASDGACSVPAADAFARMAQDSDASVRKAAVLALGRVFGAGDSDAAAQVAARLKDDDKAVRLAAVEAAGQLVKKGNIAMISAVLGCRKHEDQDIRCAAQVVLDRLPQSLAWVVTAEPRLSSPDGDDDRPRSGQTASRTTPAVMVRRRVKKAKGDAL